MAPVKILFLTVMPSPYQRQLFAAMARSPGLDVTVRYFTAGAHDREWQQSELLPHEKVMQGCTFSWLGPSAHWNPSILVEINRTAADLVVVSDYSAPTAQLAMRALALRGKPFIFWGEVPGFSPRGVAGAFLRRRLQAPLGAATALAGIGSRAVAAYQTLFPGKAVFNIPYFCDLAPYRSAAAKAVGCAKSINILFSGQLIARKGIDVLLAAFVIAARRDGRLRLLLLGSGPERAHLAAMVPPDLMDRIQFLGHREPAELPEIFAAAHVFCLPSRHDGWGVVVNEALGAGLPIIVSDAVGAGHDLIADGINGLVVRTNDVSALAAALTRITDDAVRKRMAEAVRDTAQHWDLAEGVARWHKAAESAIPGRAFA